MKAEIEVKFVKIGKVKVNKDMLEDNPKLPYYTKETIKKLCKEIENYFEDNKIKVKTNFDFKTEKKENGE